MAQQQYRIDNEGAGRGRTDSFELPPLAIPITSSIENSLADKGDAVDLSPRLRADLLDLDAWGEILTTYGRTMRAAVALTDTDGHVLGKCHNAQPVWTLVHDAAPNWTGCHFV